MSWTALLPHSGLFFVQENGEGGIFHILSPRIYGISTQQVNSHVTKKRLYGKKVDYMIYTDGGDYALLKDADKLSIVAIPASYFNRMVLE